MQNAFAVSSTSLRTTTPAALKEIGINNTDSSLSLCLSLIHKKIILSEMSSVYMWSFKGNQESEAKNELNSKTRAQFFFPDQTIAVYSSYHGQIIMVEHHKKSPSTYTIYFYLEKKIRTHISNRSSHNKFH